MKKVVPLLILFLLALMFLPAQSGAGVESLVLSNYRMGATPEYRIHYNVVGSNLYQANSDYISIIFSSKTELPVSISTADVLVNNASAKKVRTFRNLNQVDVFVPADIAVNQPVDILIKSSAGIKNPSSPGEYALGVMTSRVPSVSQRFYKITHGSVSTPKVEVSPAAVGMAAEYNISFFVSAGGELRGGSDTISITFPQEIILPIPSAINSRYITVNDIELDDDSDAFSLFGRKLTVKIPEKTSIGPEGQVTVKIKAENNIKNPYNPGPYRLSVATSRDSTDILSEAFTVYESAVTDFSVEVSPPQVNVPAQYDIQFKTGPFGSLVGRRDSITLTFPTDVELPGYISKESIEVQGKQLDPGAVTIDGRSVNIILPHDAHAGSGAVVKVRIKAGANIKNPAEPGTYSLRVKTSKNPVTARSNGYIITKRKLFTLSVGSNTAFIDGKPVWLDVPPTILNGRTMVPVRFIAELLGAWVGWDVNNRTVSVSLDGKSIILTVGSDVALINWNRHYLDTGPVIINGRTLVPIRFLAEYFGCEVEWDSRLETVTIRK